MTVAHDVQQVVHQYVHVITYWPPNVINRHSKRLGRGSGWCWSRCCFLDWGKNIAANDALLRLTPNAQATTFWQLSANRALSLRTHDTLQLRTSKFVSNYVAVHTLVSAGWFGRL